MNKKKYIAVKVGSDTVASFVVPSPRYTSLSQAVVTFSSLSSAWRRNNCEYPCLVCGGDGWYRKREDNCPVEGYKMAPRYECEACKGTGGGTKEQFKVHYDEQVKLDKQKLDLFQSELKTFIQALSLLTPDQVRVMRKRLDHFDSLPKENDSVKTIRIKN